MFFESAFAGRAVLRKLRKGRWKPSSCRADGTEGREVTGYACGHCIKKARTARRRLDILLQALDVLWRLALVAGLAAGLLFIVVWLSGQPGKYYYSGFYFYLVLIAAIAGGMYGLVCFARYLISERFMGSPDAPKQAGEAFAAYVLRRYSKNSRAFSSGPEPEPEEADVCPYCGKSSAAVCETREERGEPEFHGTVEYGINEEYSVSVYEKSVCRYCGAVLSEEKLSHAYKEVW